MKLIIAGGRDYTLTDEDYSKLNAIRGVSEIVSGGALGADFYGYIWGKQKGLPVKIFEADWETHGRAAGPIRNRQMAEYADAVALFAGGAGTASMRREAKRAGITIYDFTNS